MLSAAALFVRVAAIVDGAARFSCQASGLLPSPFSALLKVLGNTTEAQGHGEREGSDTLHFEAVSLLLCPTTISPGAYAGLLLWANCLACIAEAGGPLVRSFQTHTEKLTSKHQSAAVT